MFTADNLSKADIEVLKPICTRCDAALLCRQYARAARPKVGFWAGKAYTRAHGARGGRLMPAPLPREVRNAIADDIRTGELGRNAIARKHRVSGGTVTKIASDEGLRFENGWQTATGTEAHRIDCELKRRELEERLMSDLLALPQTSRRRDSKETRAHKRLRYKLYDLHRHAR